jgi:hypothetical protein
MNPFEKQLTKNSEKAAEQTDKLVQDVKLLLDTNASEERTLLRQIGLDRDIQAIEEKKNNELTRKRAKDRFGRAIVSEVNIQDLCKRYRLRMKHASSFVGVIPSDLPAELVRFSKEHNVVIAASNSYNNFYVIAPPKMFSDYQTFGQIVYKELTDREAEAAERKRLRDEDPILVYKIPDNPGFYAVIKSWGDDFTAIRRFYSLVMRPFPLQVLNFLHKVALVALSYWFHAKLWKYWDIITPDNVNGHEYLITVASGVVLVILATIHIYFTGVYFWEKSHGLTRKHIIRKLLR